MANISNDIKVLVPASRLSTAKARRVRRMLVGLAIVLAVPMHGPWGHHGVARAHAQGGKPASKVPSVVQQRIEQLQGARAGLGVSSVSGDLVQVTPAGELDLEFHARGSVGDAEKASLVALGATILSSTADLVWPPGTQPPPGLGMITARVPFDQVAVAAALPWVVAVTPVEVSPPDVGIFQSEGVVLHGADVAQAAGVSGAGVTVGAISDGVSNLATSQGLGELPAVTIPGGCGAGGGDEGTAMLEIIHDMAPGAALQFCATGGGVGAHVNALLSLAAAGANIIAEDIPFDSEPAFQKGLAATTAETLAASGVSVHSSAGNLGNRHAARVAAVGTAAGPDGAAGPFAGCPYNPQNVVAIAPAGDTTFDVNFPTAGTLTVTLQWSEPRAIFPTAGAGGFTNLDLFVMDGALTQCLGSSTGVQGNGAGDTIEQVSVGVAAGQTVKIVVNVRATDGAVAAPLIDLRWRGGNAVDATTRAGSLNPDSNYTDDATSAGAANASVSTDPTAVPIEGFSGGGPVQLVTTTECRNGTYPCPGPAPNDPVAGAAGRTVGAPTWTAADGVSVSGVGNFGSGSCPGVNQGDCLFFGTSAAAPHAAAVAALVREAMGTPTPAQLNARLAATATDRGTPGFDNVWGFGVLNAALAALGESADLRVIKTCKPDDLAPAGTSATCTILVDNLGPSSAQNVVLTDTNVSSGTFSFGTITTSAGTCSISGAVVTCNLGTLAAGQRATVTVPVTSTGQVDVNDIATVTSSTPDPDTSNNSATGSVRFGASADLSITKISAPNPVVAGTSLTYTITVANGGPSTATNVVVKDTLPAQVSDVSFSPSQGSCIGGIPGNPASPLTCNLGSLASGANVSIVVVTKVDPATPDGTILVNNAVVSSATADSNNGNDNATALTTVSTRADVAIVKTSDADTYKPSSRVTYRIDVTNNGESVARAVVVTDDLPTVRQALYQSDTGGCLRNSATNPTQLRCELGDLQVGETRTFFVVLLVRGNKGLVSNTASVTSTTPDPNGGNNISTRDVIVGK